MQTQRLEAFTDGVVAIIITIMVLELPVPEEPGMRALMPSAVLFAAYAVAFIKVGMYWMNHHHMLQAARCSPTCCCCSGSASCRSWSAGSARPG